MQSHVYCSFRIFPGGRTQSTRRTQAKLLLGWQEEKETPAAGIPAGRTVEPGGKQCTISSLALDKWRPLVSVQAVFLVQPEKLLVNSLLCCCPRFDPREYSVACWLFVNCQLWAESGGYQFPLSKYHPSDWYFGQISWPVLHGHCHH